MNLYLDDDMVKASRVARLRRASHHVVLPSDAELAGAWDPRHLLHSVQHRLVLISKNHDDFRDLHLLIQAANGRHAGIAVVRADNDPSKDMSDGDIERSLKNLVRANVRVDNEFHILNHWR